MEKAKRKEAAAALREIARQFEEDGQCSIPNSRRSVITFTCNAVESFVGEELRQSYEQAFGFDKEKNRNERELWKSRHVTDLRALMLCFAAAMAETGDL